MENSTIGWMLLAAAVAGGVSGLLIWRHMRSTFVRCMEEIEDTIRSICDGEDVGEVCAGEDLWEESLTAKTRQELVRLSAICRSGRESSLHQKKEIQQMVSDISHQLKTPIANIVMYQDMILAKHSKQAEEQEEEVWLRIMRGQVQKLEFLVQALLKMSRLESAVISLKMQEESLYQCIAEAAAQITRKAGQKHLQLQISCPEDLYLPMDLKWTAEAVGNVLDNAVKYSPDGAKIWITVTELALFVRVDICDEGPGIAQEYYNDIFRRFWRAPGVHQEEGVGIGLYLTREILTRQGGYCRAGAAEGGGSCFSLYFAK